MRGKVDRGIFLHDQEGITPAYAGKREPQEKTYSEAEDHPRLCGEKMQTQAKR